MAHFAKSISSALFLCLAVTAGAQTLPDGPGKATVERMCSTCHTLDSVVRLKLTKDRWANVVDDMVAKGAAASDAEIEQVVAYLSTNFGKKKVNVNKADAKELASSLEISADDAAAIVAYRSEKGSFKTAEDVAKVPGINAKKIEAAKDRLEF